MQFSVWIVLVANVSTLYEEIKENLMANSWRTFNDIHIQHSKKH